MKGALAGAEPEAGVALPALRTKSQATGAAWLSLWGFIGKEEGAVPLRL